MITILDASVVVKWFCPEDAETTAAAIRVLDAVAQDPRPFAVPDLLYSECLHVMHRKLVSDKAAVWALERLLRLGLRSLHIDHELVRHAAKGIARGLTGYDATYYACAVATGGEWLTFDAAAAKKLGRDRHVRLLAKS